MCDRKWGPYVLPPTSCPHPSVRAALSNNGQSEPFHLPDNFLKQTNVIRVCALKFFLRNVDDDMALGNRVVPTRSVVPDAGLRYGGGIQPVNNFQHRERGSCVNLKKPTNGQQHRLNSIRNPLHVSRPFIARCNITVLGRANHLEQGLVQGSQHIKCKTLSTLSKRDLATDFLPPLSLKQIKCPHMGEIRKTSALIRLLPSNPDCGEDCGNGEKGLNPSSLRRHPQRNGQSCNVNERPVECQPCNQRDQSNGQNRPKQKHPPFHSIPSVRCIATLGFSRNTLPDVWVIAIGRIRP